MTTIPLPCPFCGSTPRIVLDDGYSSCGVWCPCPAEPGVYREIGNLDAAVGAWNRRAIAKRERRLWHLCVVLAFVDGVLLGLVAVMFWLFWPFW